MLNYKWNYKPRLYKCKAISNSWNNRSLSLKGKVTVINSLITLTMLYPVTITRCPDVVMVEFKRIIMQFLWSSKVFTEQICSAELKPKKFEMWEATLQNMYA